MKICARCETINEDKNDYCSKCSQRLDNKNAVCISPENPEVYLLNKINDKLSIMLDMDRKLDDIKSAANLYFWLTIINIIFILLVIALKFSLIVAIIKGITSLFHL